MTEKIIAKLLASRVNKLLQGRKTYVAGAGLVGMGVWRISEGDAEAGIQNIIEGFGLIFLAARATRLLEKETDAGA